MLKLNTLSIFDPGTPTWQPGFERRFSKRWAAEVAVGLPFYLLYPNKNQDSFYHHNFKIKTQVKHYFKDSDSYLAAELFRTDVKFNSFNREYSTDSGSYSFQSAAFKKHIYGCTLKFGALIPVSQRWRIEPVFGYGIRAVRTSVQATDIKRAGFGVIDWFYYREKIGLKITPHMVYEAKIAYVL